MKKLVMIAALMLFLGGLKAMAGDSISAPSSETSNPIPADYGGVDIWLSTFSSRVSTVALPVASLQLPLGQYGNIASTTTPSSARWRIYGAYFSSGSCSAYDFIDIFQSTGGFVAAQLPGAAGAPGAGGFLNGTNQGAATGNGGFMRFYNVSGATSTSDGNISSCSGFNWTRWPIRMYGNVFFRPSSAGYNVQGILYYKEPD